MIAQNNVCLVVGILFFKILAGVEFVAPLEQFSNHFMGDLR